MSQPESNQIDWTREYTGLDVGYIMKILSEECLIKNQIKYPPHHNRQLWEGDQIDVGLGEIKGK